MVKKNTGRERLSIDVLPEEHRQIKAYAALYGKTMREYVLECVQKKLLEETEQKELSNISAYPDKDPILNSVWENKKDAEYDKM